MKRRDFLQTSALASTLGAFPLALLAQPGDPLKPVYLPPNTGEFLKGGRGVDIRILLRNGQTGGAAFLR